MYVIVEEWLIIGDFGLNLPILKTYVVYMLNKFVHVSIAGKMAIYRQQCMNKLLRVLTI